MTGAKITLLSNGPIRVEGEFELCDPAGNQFDLGGMTNVFLCRCGQSANKPLCDGRHRQAGFQHDVQARGLP
jgi:CDGSH-type Zn-finger protein